ncbi:nSTAND1 domain-containing NTPase [Streptomyces tauricus]|uniref:nSTAND1 domain-containing NTPase n=1 Tax=Streptomyces tauricus TaxID=68274 RepID=UPI00344AB2FC
MPRRERPLDADEGPLAEFATELRELRRAAGSPPYRTLAERAHYSISTLSSAASGQRLPTLAVTLAYARACGGDVQEWERRWRKAADFLGEENAVPAPAEESDTPPPYAGLRSFREQDAQWFFGREQLVEELAARLERRPFAAVIGASGSGKSSLLRAGLVPRLRDGATVVVWTPGPRPLEECSVRLGGLAGVTPGGLYEELRRDPANLGRVVRQIAARSEAVDGAADGRVVLVVDQFEEVFTLCRDESERSGFIEALVTAGSAGAGRCRVVLGVRADFYAHCTRDAVLVEAMRDAQVPVGPMSQDELRRAVVQPAQRAGLSVEGALLASLMAQAHAQAGMLPLLSHALLQTWRRRRGNALTLGAFEAAGGLEGSLARTAEDFYQRLDAGQRTLARRLFERLTVLGEGTEDTRRPARLDELNGLAGAGAGDVRDVLDRAADARLLTLDHERVELAHEALIRCWPRLRDWLAEDRAGIRVHRDLTEATAAWEALERDPGSLYRGVRLAQAEEWAAHAADALTARERTFLDASRAAADSERAAARRRARRLRRLTGLLTVLLLIASATTFSAVRAQDTANRQRNIALSQKAAGEAAALRATDPALAAQLSLAAYRLSPTADARGSLLSAFAGPYATRLTGHTDNVNAVAYRADSRFLATGSNDDTARLWDVADPHRPRTLAVLTGHTDKVSDLAFGPEGSQGRVLATASWDGTARLWDLGDPRRPRTTAVLRGHTGDVNAVAFSPDGRVLASASTDGTVRLWDVTDPRRPRTTQTLPGRQDARRAVLSVAFSPDGRVLAAAGFDNAVRLWTVDGSGKARRAATLTGHTAAVTWVAFGPDGKTLASGSYDRTARLWNVTDPRRSREPVTLSGHTDAVRSVAFSPDGRTLASAGMDQDVRLWDVGDPRRPRRGAVLSGHTDAAVFVAFGPDGRTLASAGDDQTVRLWDLPVPGLGGHTDTVCAVAFGPGGRLLATAGDDRTARLWNVTDPRRPRELATVTGHKDAVCGLALSPDGRVLATGSWDRTARLWDIADPRRPRELGTVSGHGDHVNTVTFGPGGRTLAVSGGDGTVRLWNVAEPRRPRELATLRGHTGGANTAVHSPDGRTLATGGWDGTVRLWDVADPRRPRKLDTSAVLREGVNAAAFSPDGRTLATADFGDTVRLWQVGGRRLREAATLAGHVGAVHSPVFSPDGRTLATTGADGTVRLWDVRDPDRPGAPASLVGDGEHTYTAAFSPDGHTLASGGAARTARLWETAPERVADRVCRTARPTITSAQWAEYFGDLAYRPPCR